MSIILNMYICNVSEVAYNKKKIQNNETDVIPALLY